MVSKLDDLPILKFLEKLTFLFFKKWSQYRVTCPFWTSKEIILPRGVKQCRFTIPILFRSSIDLRFRTSAVPKNLETILAFITPFPARLVLWKYSMHVFVTFFFLKHRSPFLLLPSSSSCFHLFTRPVLFNQYVLHVLHFLSFYA
jgi:hypothetical protein